MYLITKYSNITPKVFSFLVAVLVALIIDVTIGFFLPKSPPVIEIETEKKANISFNVITKLGIISKEVVVTKQSIELSDNNLILTAFKMSAFYIKGKRKFIMIKDGAKSKLIDLDEVYKGYKLVDVFPYRAKFLKANVTYWLYMNSDEAKGHIEKEAAQKSENIKKQMVADIKRQNVMFEKIKFKDGTYFIPQTIMSEFNDLSKIFRDISLQSIRNTKGNRKLKYKIRRLRAGSVFSKLGLRKGDFITQIDGKILGGDADAFKLFNNMSSLEHISITVKRGAKEQELKYEIF
ncbi:MAG: hypothetical protein GQ570_01965 [Helicobacteraceae bacterium]|nr:hypothetical protein [Helicobacteraceae bacterium]